MNNIELNAKRPAVHFGPGRFQNSGSLLTYLGDIRDVADFSLDQILKPGYAGMDQGISLFAGDAWDGCQLRYRFGHFFVKSFGDHLLGLNIDLPAGQAGGQAGVLAALVLLAGVSLYNNLAASRVRCDAAWSDIDVTRASEARISPMAASSPPGKMQASIQSGEPW